MIIRRPVITIATYRRPEYLRMLLEVCVEQRKDVDTAVRIVVVDNDPSESAKAVVAQFTDVDYLVEAQPGIAAARNRGLAALSDDDDAAIFIDDDEVPAIGWLKALIHYADETRADIVTGPVEPLITDDVPPWIVRGGFWRRSTLPTGSIPQSIATNNTLLRLSAWRGLDLWFSDALSMKGGSDTEFFRSIRAQRTIDARWCSEAVVQEHVLAERANVRWLFRRATRIGNINARYRSRVSAFFGGCARIAIGFPYTIVDLLVHRHVMARSLNMLAHGVGMIGNVVNADVVEYQRATNGA